MYTRYVSSKKWFAKYFADVTNYEIAKRLGVSKQLVSHWSTGRQKPSLESLHRLCFEIDIVDKKNSKNAFESAINAVIKDIKTAKNKLT